MNQPCARKINFSLRGERGSKENLIFPELSLRKISRIRLYPKSIVITFDDGGELEIRTPTAYYYYDLGIKNWAGRCISKVTASKADDEGFNSMTFRFEKILSIFTITHVLSFELNRESLCGESLRERRPG